MSGSITQQTAVTVGLEDLKNGTFTATIRQNILVRGSDTIKILSSSPP